MGIKMEDRIVSDDGLKDLTEHVMLYRETVRHMWNTAFAKDADWNRRDDFDEACVLLFRILVLHHVAPVEGDIAVGAASDPAPLTCLRVVPTVDGTSILINRTSPRSGYWDDPQRTVNPRDI